MKLVFLLGLQAATPAPPAAPRVDSVHFDLAKAGQTRDRGVHGLFACDRSGPDVVVCGHRAGPAYPLAEMARIYEPKHIRAEMGLGNGATGDVHTEQVVMPNGRISKRILVGLKLPF